MNVFCPECGSKNADDAIFCENCGANISAALREASAQQNVPQAGAVQSAAQPPRYTPPTGTSPASAAGALSPSAPKARKPLKKSTKIVLAAVAVAVVAGVVLFQVGKNLTSPEKAALDYFGELKSQDWNAAYQQLDIGDKGLLTEKNFEKVQKESAKDEKIVNYAVSTAKLTDIISNGQGTGTSSKSTDALTKRVTIQYTTRGSSSPKTQVLCLIKQPEKKWFFFDSWKISPEDCVTPEVTVSAPSGITVFFGDIKLDSKYISKDKGSDSDDSESDNSTVTYTVKNVFSGNYTLKATSSDTEDLTQAADIDSSNCQFTFDLSNFKLKQEVTDAVAKQPEDVVKALYSAALAGKDFSSVSSSFVSDGDERQDLEDDYANIKDLVASGNNGGFKSIDFTSFDSKAEKDASNLTGILVETTVNYSFTAVQTNYFADSPSSPYTGNDSATVRMKFRNVNGKWLVEQMSGIELSYDNGYLGLN